MTTRVAIITAIACSLSCIADAASAATLPSSIPGNVLWLDGNDVDGNGIPGGSLVGGTDWIDKSPAGNDMTQTGPAGSIPSVLSGGPLFNGNSVVQFDGDNDELGNTSVSYDARSVFIVFRADSGLQDATSGLALGQLWGNYDDGVHVAIEARTGNPIEDGFSFDGSGAATASYSLDNTLPFTASAEGSIEQMWAFDDVHLISAVFDANEALTAQYISFLNSSLSSHRFGGDIADLIVFDRILTDGSLDNMDNEFNDVLFFLQQKHDLGLGVQATPVPEPSTLSLLGITLFGFASRRRRSARRG